jgi:hypothetical protein
MNIFIVEAFEAYIKANKWEQALRVILNYNDK